MMKLIAHSSLHHTKNEIVSGQRSLRGVSALVVSGAFAMALVAGAGSVHASVSTAARPTVHATADKQVREARLVNPNSASQIALPCDERLSDIAAVEQKPSTGPSKPSVIKPGQIQAQEVNSSVPSSIGQLLDPNICDGTYCVNLPKVAASIHQQLDCNVVGYAFYAGNALTGVKADFESWGQARTNANKPAAKFTADSKIQIASTSKVLTALMALKAIGSKVNNLAYTYFPPSWNVPQASIVRNITIRQFISQTSGVQQYYAGVGGQTYANLQAFFTQPILTPGAAYSCPFAQGGNGPIPNPIISNTQPCYTDTNFGLMRIVVPRAAGTTNSSDPQTLADSYVKLVQDNVLAPVGVTGDACEQPASGYALAYNLPGTSSGTNFSSPLTLTCGDWGWWLSVKDYARVLISLNSQDGKILGNCGLNDMVTNPASHPVGWDIKSDGTHRWVEKNGGDGWGTNAGSGQMSSSVGLYIGRDGCVVKGKGTAPVAGVAAVLFVNSNIKGQTYGADTVLIKALQAGTTAE
jgi:CubicO group peptidase (beta-lactamase class C family)